MSTIFEIKNNQHISTHMFATIIIIIKALTRSQHGENSFCGHQAKSQPLQLRSLVKFNLQLSHPDVAAVRAPDLSFAMSSYVN